MLSKWAPWELLKNYPNFFPATKGLVIYLIQDPFLERIFMARFEKSQLSQTPWRKMTGVETNVPSIEEAVFNPGLLGADESILVRRAHEFSSAVTNYLLETEINPSDKQFVLVFSKENKLFKKLSKEEHVTSIVVKETPFWEYRKLFEFMASELEVRCSFEVQSYILENVSSDVGEYFNALTKLSQYFREKVIDNLDQVKLIITPNKFDQFLLASLFSKKDFKSFYEKLSVIENDYDSMRSLFSFMQGHLIKMADHSYIEKKARPSKYDKEIEACAKLWQEDELSHSLRKFSKWEVLAKQKSANLISEMKRHTLREML
jgi:DNA polymerase III delta subunit